MNKEGRVGAQIRRAVAEDAPQIASVLRAAFAEYESLYTAEGFALTISTTRQIRERLEEGPTWVAVEDEAIIGTVSAVSRAGSLYIRSMAVAPEARGRGLGQELLECTEEYAARNGFTRLFLSTTPFLSGAIRLYERNGFRRNDEGPHDLMGTPLFTMVKMLESEEKT